MEYTHLGRTGLSVSRAVLGTMNFGPQTSEEDSFAIMDRAHDLGVNFFDTANVYGWQKGEGVTEQIVGRWFAQGGGRRERTVIATKLYGDMGDWPNESKLSALAIRRQLDDSLRRLQTDHVDLYQFHHIDRETPWEEIWQAMEVAVQQGKVLYAGSSNFAGWHIAQAQEAAARRNFVGLVSEQSIYNLLVRDVERETLPAARAYGLGMIPWSPLQGGLLGGVIEKTEEGSRRLEGRAKEALEANRPAIEQYEAFAKEIGHAPGELALAWLLHQPGVTAPITGPRTMQQLESAVASVDIHLDQAALDRLDEIFPGHKTSPEDYAW
ncbi:MULTISPECIES: aldo/keto reductase [unclassified Curtobacterium]|uniref:aldo/keto reductase n=1 Tax=unclassified Curtobacterium TaxID=257496 RepID=UPI000DA7F14A|nr:MULTISPECIES: aldo/keto reductase [unclassified Curtobacterium]PZE29806.1 aldo/keto reductase [Curtobacterium sp. MCBD17_028]PZE75788.1 aldo/keto reductase [Curtobacterium sp. MCBD17_019]PZF60850.1 aldo/keto reductase [Curtobacterium sp. MCBD17_034]PZM40199.1 aldo/keto reductase [Curtobacterium sp. MCBD17_031]WIB68850.1 aldo/keto reductase [Curtobacterium sp. MCBD17_035]